MAHMTALLQILVFCISTISWCIADERISDPNFDVGDTRNTGKTVIYRLIGNDMPPLQQRGQLRWNTKYALDNEAKFPGVVKRWILNHVWNDTDFRGIYSDLIASGVNRRDILTRCFDLDQYKKEDTIDDKLFYLTAQNEGRNAGIIDGRESGFEWIVILDGNTFITQDSWAAIASALDKAKKKNQKYLKIPYHRVHSEQSTKWLNIDTKINTVLEYAPVKGESQIAFHRTAKEMFTLGKRTLLSALSVSMNVLLDSTSTLTNTTWTVSYLGDTKPDAKDPHKRRGYGARNKSYMFKEGAICGPGSKECACADVVEGNEEDMHDKDTSYAKECGVVLRLWNYPTDSVSTTLHNIEHDSVVLWHIFVTDVLCL